MSEAFVEPFATWFEVVWKALMVVEQIVVDLVRGSREVLQRLDDE